MKDISKYFVKSNSSDEVIWDQPRYKVILFRNGSPFSYISLDDTENTKEIVLEKASVLLQGGGTKLMSV